MSLLKFLANEIEICLVRVRNDATVFAHDLRQDFCVVTAAGKQVEDGHTAINAQELENLVGLAARVARVVAFEARRKCEYCGVIHRFCLGHDIGCTFVRGWPPTTRSQNECEQK